MKSVAGIRPLYPTKPWMNNMQALQPHSPMKGKVKQICFFVLQCTWGILQTLLGLCLALCCPVIREGWHGGSLLLRWPKAGGVSLGAFVFVSASLPENQAEAMIAHEYGHAVQSLLLGPLYLPLIGIPSLVWCNFPYCKRLRAAKNLPYSAFWVERWADHLGNRYFFCRR